MPRISEDLTDDIEEVLYTREEISERVRKIGEKISRDYQGKPLVLVGILRGALIFLSDLTRNVTIEHSFDMVGASSYGASTSSSGRVQITKDVEVNLRDKHVVIIEDIYDSGRTLAAIRDLLRVHHPASIEVAALLADTLTTGFGAVTRDARVALGEAVIVIGVGGIGLGTVLGAHLAGACPVIAVDIHEHKLAKAREFGATHTINTREENLADAVHRILGGPADVVFDVTGNPTVIEQAWRVTGPKGRLVLVGVMRHDQHLSLNTLPLHYGKTLTGTEGGSSQPQHDIPRYLRMIRAGRFDPRGMVSHRCGLADVNTAIAAMRAGESIHTMIHL